MIYRYNPKSDLEALLQEVQERATRFLELQAFAESTRVGTAEFTAGKLRLMSASDAWARTIDSLEAWRAAHTPQQEIQRPVRRRGAPTAPPSADTAGNVKPGWTLRYDGADRLVRYVGIHAPKSEGAGRQVNIWFEDMTIGVHETHVIHVVSTGEETSK